jgi:peptidyl-dipeptidase Dcp
MQKQRTKSKRGRASAGAANPLLAAWRTPFQLPPFDKIEPAHFGAAFPVVLRQHRKEIREIARSDTRPTFANTIVAMERSGKLLNRVCDVFFNLTAAHTNEALQAIERDIAPKLAAHSSAIMLDRALFARIDDLYQRRDRLKLDDEELRLLELQHLWFVRAGARLSPRDKKRVAAINERLAVLGTQFAQNVLKDEQSWHLLLDGERDLDGLPDDLRAQAARAAADRGAPGKHAITLARSSVEPFLQFSSRRDLREQAFNAWIRRGEMGKATDNRGIVAETIALRTELAKLIGYESYADYSLADTMAKTPANVAALLNDIWPRAVARAGEESEALAQRARAEGSNAPIAPWDWRYYAEKERKARFALDEAEIRPFLPLEGVIAAAFDTASRLFGLSFEELPDAPRYHPDVRVWEVRDKKGGHVGVFLGDYFARSSKRSGAWMSSFRTQHKLGKGARPVIVNVMSFARAAQDKPALLSFDEARTLFHEFGHGLHGLLSDVTFPSMAGTAVVRDFVELPSQLYEHWLSRPEVLERFARRHDTGQPMPKKLLARLKAARNFNQGFATVEYTACALLDMELHALRDAEDLDVSRFERDALQRLGMPAEIVMRHRIPHFLHIMGGYAAGYYSYLWSEVMDADAFAAFEEAGDVFDAKTAARLKKYIYAAGNRRDPAQAYAAFRGRAPKIDSLMRKRGFA